MEGCGIASTPLQLCENLAHVLNLVEETCTWLVPLTRGLPLIPKGEESAPQASLYRLWASMRIRDIIHWQEKWADTALHGYRPGRRAEDVSMDLVLADAIRAG